MTVDREQRHAIIEAVRMCRDRETMKTIALALGLEGPPDFSAAPSTDAPAAAQEGSNA